MNTFKFRSFIFAVVLFMISSVNNFLNAGVDDKSKEKTAAEDNKNIQVLKELPASQLDPLMDYFAASLGVQCNHCHVIDTTGWYMEKDDKRTKQQARKMIKMVMDMNKNEFSGRTAVTCYTCHRGSIAPANLLPLPQALVKPRQEESKSLPTLPSVDQLISMYENALGGSDAINKIKSRVSKGVSVDAQGKEMPTEISQESSSKFVTSTTIREGVTRSAGFNGTNGWMSSPRGSRELSPEESEGMKREAAMFPIAEMREFGKKMYVKEKEIIDGRNTYVLTTQVDEHTTTKFYIDSTSNLLVRKATILSTMLADIPEQTDYSDYRAIDGVKVPFTVSKSEVDPKHNSTQRIASIEQNVSIDKKKFMMPEAKPKGK